MAASEQCVVRGYEAARAVLADGRFEVGGPGEPGLEGTVAWLRGMVTRFANGPEHDRRLAVLLGELATLDPASLRADAERRCVALLEYSGDAGGEVELMSLVARSVPVAAIAAALGFADAEAAARDTATVAAAYFPGSPPELEPAADGALHRLLVSAGPGDVDNLVARIALLVQTCDATAGLVGNALEVLREAGRQAEGWETEALLAEVARHRGPLRRTRRVATEAVGTLPVEAGGHVVLDVDAANRDPDVFEQPDDFDPARKQRPSLTFGYGLRPCPGEEHAMALAAGVVDAVRTRCRLPAARAVEYEASPALRIPSAVWAVRA